jgi:prefoldin alpha subunit
MIWLQSTKDATKFYEAKVDDLGNNLKDLEAIIGQKSNNLRVVEDGKSHSRF